MSAACAGAALLAQSWEEVATIASLAAASTIRTVSSIGRWISAPAARMWAPPPKAGHSAAAATAPRYACLRERVVDVLEEDGRLEPRDAVEGVDDALGLGHHGIRLFEHATGHIGPCKPAFHLHAH